MNQLIKGSFGDSPKKPRIEEDTLIQPQVYKVLFVVSEGEIESIEDILCNNVSITNYDADFIFTYGEDEQASLLGFEAIESTIGIGTNLTYNTPVIYTVSSSAVDRIRPTILFSSLVQTNSSGDRLKYTVTFKVETRPDNASIWTELTTLTVTGKYSTSAPYEFEVDKPTGGLVWSVRITRLTVDDDSNHSSATSLSSAIEVQKDTKSYPGSALVGIRFNDATELGGSVPIISFRGKWMKFKVPSSTFYDSVTKKYALYSDSDVFEYYNPNHTYLTWDGSFEPSKKHTNNLSWVLYNLRADTLYHTIDGRQVMVSCGTPELYFDKFSFYEFAKVCDERLSYTYIDANSSSSTVYEHRFEFNGQLIERGSAETILNYLKQVGNCELVEINGLITVIWDSQSELKLILNNTNVLDGLFDYPGNDIAENFTACTVTYQNKFDNNNTSVVSEQVSDELIRRYGYNSTDILLVGCISEYAARRKARHVLYHSTIVPNFVRFTIGELGNLLYLGSVFSIYDNEKLNVVSAGRVVSFTTASYSTITLDREINIPDIASSISLCLEDGTFVTYDIVESGVVTDVVTTVLPLPAALIPDSQFNITNIAPESKYKVILKKPVEGGYEINAVEFLDSGKSYIEDGIVIAQNTVATYYDLSYTPPVTDITVTPFYSVESTVYYNNKLTISWDWAHPEGITYNATYVVVVNYPDGSITTVTGLPKKEYELTNLQDASILITIYAINPSNVYSLGTKLTYNYTATQPYIPSIDDILIDIDGSIVLDLDDTILTD